MLIFTACSYSDLYCKFWIHLTLSNFIIHASTLKLEIRPRILILKVNPLLKREGFPIVLSNRNYSGWSKFKKKKWKAWKSHCYNWDQLRKVQHDMIWHLFDPIIVNFKDFNTNYMLQSLGLSWSPTSCNYWSRQWTDCKFTWTLSWTKQLVWTFTMSNCFRNWSLKLYIWTATSLEKL